MKPDPPQKHDLEITHSPANVPVFNCVVYLSTRADGSVRARVANLAGLQCAAGSEREALGRIVAAFKDHVAQLTHTQSDIPWIEPPVAAEPNERERYIPVHL